MSLLLQKEGIFTSLQSLDGAGRQSFGINPRGPMDRFAARVANLLVENDEHLNVLETHFPAAQIVFKKDCIFALAGADFAAVINGNPIRNWSAHSARVGDVLKFERKEFGTRAYLAINGGLKRPTTDSRYSTARLSKETLIERRTSAHFDQRSDDNHFFVSKSIRPPYSSFPTVRILPGGEFERLTDDAKDVLTSSSFSISNESNRMGYRLNGNELSLSTNSEMVSAAVTIGTIQLLPDGQMIVLMADHQTSGGYPRIANVISADLPLLAQLGPNDKVAFTLTDIAEAERFALQIETDLKKLRAGVKFGRYW